jgi:hypothetical protein
MFALGFTHLQRVMPLISLLVSQRSSGQVGVVVSATRLQIEITWYSNLTLISSSDAVDLSSLRPGVS